MKIVNHRHAVEVQIVMYEDKSAILKILQISSVVSLCTVAFIWMPFPYKDYPTEQYVESDLKTAAHLPDEGIASQLERAKAQKDLQNIQKKLLKIPQAKKRVRVPENPRTHLAWSFREYEPSVYTDDQTVPYIVSGLRNLTVRETSSFFVDTRGHVLPNSPVEYVRILFYGIAAFTPQQWTGDLNGVWEAKFHVEDSGLYHVHIESLFRNSSQGIHLYRKVEGSPFTLLVRPPNTEHMSDSEVLKSMQQKFHQFPNLPVGTINYPNQLCPDAVWRQGRWVRCYDTPEPCVRTGWIWLPEACHYHIFTADEIRNLPNPLWIVFAGTSVQRGTYFALIDLIVKGGAQNLTASPFWKCWGWMDFSYRNIRLSYLDFRTQFILDTDKGLVVDQDYYRDARLALGELGKTDGHGPDLFYLEDHYPTMHSSKIYRSWLGSEWTGRFAVHSSKPCSGFDMCGEKLRQNLRGEKPFFWTSFENNPQPGIQGVDESRMTLPFMHDQEQPMSKGVSLHFHRACNDAGMYSCSVISDMAAQQLLNAYFNKKEGSRNRVSTIETGRSSGDDYRFCLHCPKDLVPFTIKPRFDDVKCHSHIPLADENV